MIILQNNFNKQYFRLVYYIIYILVTFKCALLFSLIFLKVMSHIFVRKNYTHHIFYNIYNNIHKFDFLKYTRI